MMFNDLVCRRDEVIDGVGGWMWVKSDNGAWDGPKKDWPSLKEGILKYVKSFNVCVQAGGNCGMYPRLLSNMFKNVYTFEPDALNFHCLVNNCQSENIYKFNSALGETNKLLRVHSISNDNVGMHKVKDDGVCNVPTFTIDQLSLTQCDFIQLDCEGYEPNVVLGAMDTITKFKPVISLETMDNTIEQLLFPLGYTNKGQFGHIDKIFSVE